MCARSGLSCWLHWSHETLLLFFKTWILSSHYVCKSSRQSHKNRTGAYSWCSEHPHSPLSPWCPISLHFPLRGHSHIVLCLAQWSIVSLVLPRSKWIWSGRPRWQDLCGRGILHLDQRASGMHSGERCGFITVVTVQNYHIEGDEFSYFIDDVLLMQ